jgi:hypothetical protein
MRRQAIVDVEHEIAGARGVREGQAPVRVLRAQEEGAAVDVEHHRQRPRQEGGPVDVEAVVGVRPVGDVADQLDAVAGAAQAGDAVGQLRVGLEDAVDRLAAPALARAECRVVDRDGHAHSRKVLRAIRG